MPIASTFDDATFDNNADVFGEHHHFDNPMHVEIDEQLQAALDTDAEQRSEFVRHYFQSQGLLSDSTDDDADRDDFNKRYPDFVDNMPSELVQALVLQPNCPPSPGSQSFDGLCFDLHAVDEPFSGLDIDSQFSYRPY